MKAARSLMFVPGHRQDMIGKALAMAELDVALLDLEDGVPPAETANARRLVADATREKRAVRMFVRVHAVGPEIYPDLAAVGAAAEAVVLAKTQSADDVRAAEGVFARVGLVPSIETAAGLLAAPEIARASSRVAGLMFGGEDFARDLGLPPARTGEAQELLFARSATVVAAVAARVPAYDSVWTDIRDLDGLRAQARQARNLGFTGKTLIHPSHVAIVNEAFTPTPDEIAHARRVVAAFEDALRERRGAVAVDGEMVDAPVAERARRLLDLGRG